MKDEIQKIIRLFQKYGFEYRKRMSKTNFLAFTYKSGFFHNAELVSLTSEEVPSTSKEMQSAADDLEKMGFSTKKTFFKSYEELEKTLFEGFFNTKDWRESIREEYKKHSERVLNVLPKEACTYNYIEVPYWKNNQETTIPLIQDICNNLSSNKPELFIIEAPAGFGKTCTSFEIINTLVNKDKDDTPIPFFTEFSRDRQARVFSHIFVKEVDRSFTSVNSEVVIEEVKEGRIVVVLDGFDELLHDSNPNEDNNGFENAEPMLETISELLVNKAKVILTSRRSAIFDGEMFGEWVEKYTDNFTISRYRLEKPMINDWLTPNRLDLLNSTEIFDISKLANPVLLSFLRFVDDDYFKQLCAQPALIVEKYFSSMLEREIDRQELRMNPEQQTILLSIVASDMCENDYTSDSKEKIINIIKEKAADLLKDVRKMYTAVDRPTIDKLATTLSNHAFFDRSNQGENNIQFVNEFVLGNYISENILKTEDWMASDERFVEPAVLSYVPREKRIKETLWRKLSTMNDFLDISSRMKFEGLLTNQIRDNVYNDTDISSLTLRSIEFFKTGSITNSIFNKNTFHNTIFYYHNLKDITFLSCDFWDCTFHLNDGALISDINFLNCHDNNNFISDSEDESLEDSTSGDKTDIKDYILLKFWPEGQTSLKSLFYFTASLFKTNNFSKKEIIKEIKSLKKEKLLIEAHDSNFIAINKSKIIEIKKILGRT